MAEYKINYKPRRFRENQYLLFEKSIAKINKINNGTIIMRKFTKGTTQHGYDWQHKVSYNYLERLYQEHKVRIIPPLEVLKLLLANFEGCMPIKDVKEW